MDSGSDESSNEGMQLSMLSRKRLVRLVTESQQNHQQQLLNHRRTAQKKNKNTTKRSKLSEKPKAVEKNPRPDSLQQLFLQHASASNATTATLPTATNNGSDLATDPPLETSRMETDVQYHHHHTAILPPSQRVDTGADEQLSSKSGGTGVTPPPPAPSCPPPVVYYRRAAAAAAPHVRTSYRSLTSNASSTAAELDCLLSVSTPPGLVRNTTSSSVRWSGLARPSNPVPMQVDDATSNNNNTGLPDAASTMASPMTTVATAPGAPPSWTPESGFAPYQYQHPGQYHC